MWKRFTNRNTQLPDKYRYDIPSNVRSRLYHSFDDLIARSGFQLSLSHVLEQVGKKLLQEYGRLSKAEFKGMSVRTNPVIEHFFACDDELALDFIEFCFQVYPHPLREEAVEVVNTIFQQETIGYELTPFREIVTHEKSNRLGPGTGGRLIKYDFPAFVKKDEQFVHEAIVRPCLDALAKPILKTAEKEMLKAHHEYSKGNYADAITSCCSSFESVLKTICDKHGWTYDKDKDTCWKLVGICKDNGLFPPFYAPIFEAVGTVRNKLGDAHGRGPAPLYAVSKEHADHMIQMTSAHITLIVKLRKL